MITAENEVTIQFHFYELYGIDKFRIESQKIIVT